MKNFQFQISNFKLIVAVIFPLLFLAIFLYPNPYTLTPSFASHTPCHPSASFIPRVSEGLITAPSPLPSGFKFWSSSGECIVDSKVVIPTSKFQSFSSLKTLFYTKVNPTSSASFEKINTMAPPGGTQTGGIDLGSKDRLYHITGNLSITSPSDITGAKTGVIFVDGNLTIGPLSPSNKLIHGNNDSGLVFVVGGNVYIAPEVTQIDAVIVAHGKIYTASAAGSACTKSSVTTTGSSPISALTVNGSLISLDGAKPIEFCRKIANDNNPSEIINYQPKYLIILRDIFSESRQIWTEIP